MFDKLKKYCSSVVSLTELELKLIDNYFEQHQLNKKELLLKDGAGCDFIGFVAEGSIRHFHIKDGVERTCDISLEQSWVTDFQSFTYSTEAIMNLQALEPTIIFLVRKDNLFKLYTECPKYETFGRVMAENIAQRATEIAMSLSSDKPEERFNKLLNKRLDLFQRVPQKYIANFLGVSPESLSRIRKRVLQKQKS